MSNFIFYKFKRNKFNIYKNRIFQKILTTKKYLMKKFYRSLIDKTKLKIYDIIKLNYKF